MSLINGGIVVLVRHQNTYRWFVSERDFWVLDQESWRRAFVEAGYDDDPSYAERFGIAVVKRRVCDLYKTLRWANSASTRIPEHGELSFPVAEGDPDGESL